MVQAEGCKPHIHGMSVYDVLLPALDVLCDRLGPLAKFAPIISISLDKGLIMS